MVAARDAELAAASTSLPPGRDAQESIGECIEWKQCEIVEDDGRDEPDSDRLPPRMRIPQCFRIEGEQDVAG